MLCRGFGPDRLDADAFAVLVQDFADNAALWTRELAQPAMKPLAEMRAILPEMATVAAAGDEVVEFLLRQDRPAGCAAGFVRR